MPAVLQVGGGRGGCAGTQVHFAGSFEAGEVRYEARAMDFFEMSFGLCWLVFDSIRPIRADGHRRDVPMTTSSGLCGICCDSSTRSKEVIVRPEPPQR